MCSGRCLANARVQPNPDAIRIIVYHKTVKKYTLNYKAFFTEKWEK